MEDPDGLWDNLREVMSLGHRDLLSIIGVLQIVFSRVAAIQKRGNLPDEAAALTNDLVVFFGCTLVNLAEICRRVGEGLRDLNGRRPA